MTNYLRDNVIHIITLIFLAGKAYSDFRMLRKDVDHIRDYELRTIEDRLDKKIKMLNEHDKRLYKLESTK